MQKLGGEIGERNLSRYPQLRAAAQYIESELSGWKVRRDGYEVQGKSCYNLEAELPGASPGIILVGAHYDSVYGSPGANDNGSGVAALLALAHRLAGRPNEKTLRFVAFVNEEPGYFQTPQMGSFVYASRSREHGDQIEAMISLETIGYFSNQSGSQKYPVPGLALIYPRTGNFIGFVSNVASRSLLRNVIGDFRREAQIPSEGGALPAMVPGVGWSDQWSFWQHGYPGIMVTDTAPFRYPYYHSSRRHTGQTGLRLHDTRRGRNGESHSSPAKPSPQALKRLVCRYRLAIQKPNANSPRRKWIDSSPRFIGRIQNAAGDTRPIRETLQARRLFPWAALPKPNAPYPSTRQR